MSPVSRARGPAPQGGCSAPLLATSASSRPKSASRPAGLTTNAKVPGAPFRATRPLATVVWFSPPLPPSCRAQPTKQSEHPGTNLGLTVHAEKTVLFCFVFYFPAPARRARDQHCFVRDNELFPASVRLAQADTTGLLTHGKPPRPHGNPREGSSPRGAAQAPPEVRGAKKTCIGPGRGRRPGLDQHSQEHRRLRADHAPRRPPRARPRHADQVPRGAVCRARGPANERTERLGPRAHSGPAPRSAVLPWAPHTHPAPIRPTEFIARFLLELIKPSTPPPPPPAASGAGRAPGVGERGSGVCLASRARERAVPGTTPHATHVPREGLPAASGGCHYYFPQLHERGNRAYQ